MPQNIDEMRPRIIAEKFLEPFRAGLRTYDTGADKPRFGADKWFELKIWVERAHNLHIGVEIYATAMVEGMKPAHVRHVGIAAHSVRLAAVDILRDIEITFVPFANLIVRQHLLPGFHIAEELFRLRATPEPAIMDYFRYHACYLFIFL